MCHIVAVSHDRLQQYVRLGSIAVMILSGMPIWKMTTKIIGYNLYNRTPTRNRAIGNEMFMCIPEPAHKFDYFTPVVSTPQEMNIIHLSYGPPLG